ncbi:30S ribosomal protein S2 [Candidatus Dependentiae bacterium]|nr:30S ribosomal protein S2 [Candidatus Dependentiae bacterium]MCC7415301.1 30S ribosomal protein S2 [Campylobacterota bacterium]
MIDFRLLVKAGVHFGHQKMRWCPKMEQYIWGYKNNVYLIDVSKTASQLEKASLFLHDIASQGKSILWVGTKKAARDIIQETATGLGMPYVVHRWIGGTLSNNSQVKKSVTKLLHYEDILAKTDSFSHHTKKELNVFKKMVDRLAKNIGGIRTLGWPVGAVVIVDVRKEHSALKEASSMGVPVVAIVDTNSDPSLVDYVIPANDDAPRSIKVLTDYLAESVSEGKKKAAARKVEQAAERKVKAGSEKTEKQLMQEAAVAAMLREDEDAPASSKQPAHRQARPADRGGQRSGAGRAPFKGKK